MRGQKLSEDELRAAIATLNACGGNISEAARRSGLPRITFRDRILEAKTRLGVESGKMADGRVDQIDQTKRALPAEGCVARYVITSAQNNTHVHPGFANLKAYAEWLDVQPGSSCELIIGTFSYALDAYGAKSVKRGTWSPEDSMWYAPELVPFLVDESVRLAPGLVWCGEMNILPTAKHPLTGLEEYNGRKSNIVPHVKIEMESIASLQDEATKFNYSTGTVTQRNYIQKRAGIIAEQSHTYGGLIVEVDHGGNWWVRQLHIGKDNVIYDVGPAPGGPVKVEAGKVTRPRQSVVEGVSWGDIHAAEMDLWVRELAWGPGGMLDTLQPRAQFLHDIFSMRARGHHEMKDFHRTYQKMVAGEDSVEGEIHVTADFLVDAVRAGVETVVVPSNHDRHLTRWLNEADPRHDPKNARYHSELQATLLQAMDRSEDEFNILKHALLQARPDLKDDWCGLRFLEEEESYVICRDAAGGVECALHGDQGPNGSRGATRNLTRLGRAINKGHDHTAAIRDRVYSAGACSMSFPYMHGPTSHSISHIATFTNAARQILTMWAGRWRA